MEDPHRYQLGVMLVETHSKKDKNSQERFLQWSWGCAITEHSVVIH